MNCSISIKGNYAEVSSPERVGRLTLDMSHTYCRLFESAKSQGRDYMTSIERWCGRCPDNSDMLMRSILLYIVPVRTSIGMKR